MQNKQISRIKFINNKITLYITQKKIYPINAKCNEAKKQATDGFRSKCAAMLWEFLNKVDSQFVKKTIIISKTTSSR